MKSVFDSAHSATIALRQGIADSTRPKRQARARGRAADWQGQIGRAAAYGMSRARSAEEAAAIEREYEEAMARGPDFTRYRGKSAFLEAPRITLDRNQLARIKFMLEAIRRGGWRAKPKGKHAGDIKHSVIEVFDALVRLARKHGRVFPSLVGLCQLSTRSKQTVINALKTLELYGFITVHRRIKNVRTSLGIRTVQETNAYQIHEPATGLGRLALSIFMEGGSESRSHAARKPDPLFKEGAGGNSGPRMPWDDPWSALKAQWEAE